MSEAKTTTNHDEIRQWVEERGGCPARVKGTGGESDPGVLRIDYPGGPGNDEALEEISWDEWFAWFDSNNLTFLYQEETKEGDESRFSKLVSRAERT